MYASVGKNCYLKGGFKMLDLDNFWGSNLTVWCCAEAEHVKFSKKLFLHYAKFKPI